MTDNYRDTLYSNYVSRFKGKLASSRPSFEEMLWPLRGWLPEDRAAPILEAACGQGTLLSALRSRNFTDTLGIDFSEEQVKACSPDAGEIIHGDAIAFLESGRKFELIIAFDFLEHLRKDEVFRFLNAAHSSGKTLILRLPNAAAPRGMYHQAGDFTHESMFSPSSLKQVLSSANFSRTEFREVSPVPLSPKGVVRSAMWRGLRSVYQLSDIVELGGPSGLYSRNMLVRASY